MTPGTRLAVYSQRWKRCCYGGEAWEEGTMRFKEHYRVELLRTNLVQRLSVVLSMRV
jgi:hypothetical protein